MASIDVDPDVFTDDELVQEIRNRLQRTYRNNAQNAVLRLDLEHAIGIQVDRPEKLSMMDESKINYFLANRNEIKQEQLEMIVEHKLAVA